jgi:AraC-like DNA-binding protein
MKLHVKNMVCNRCKMVVKAELEKMGLKVLAVDLGEVTLDKELTDNERSVADGLLQKLGFSIIDDKKSQIIVKIKALIVELVHQHNNELKINLSDYLCNHFDQDYNYLSTLFSVVEGTTIEKYYIAQKIEKVKELLRYDELTLSEIAWQLNYSSVAHLSKQFKKATGLTPGFFKNMKSNRRKPLDEV